MNCIVVYEQDGVWAAGLRQRLHPTDCLTIVQVTTAGAVMDTLQKAPTGAVVWDVMTPTPQFLTQTLPDLKASFPQALVIVATHDDDPALPAYYEAGATLVATRPWKLDKTTHAIRQHFANQPPPSETTREKIWNALPWQTNHFEN